MYHRRNYAIPFENVTSMNTSNQIQEITETRGDRERGRLATYRGGWQLKREGGCNVLPVREIRVDKKE